VRDRDSKNNNHQATNNTSMFSGVNFTEDRIVSHMNHPPSEQRSHDDLTAENRRLRERIEQLERERS